jgi:hypothetical protein
VAKTMGWRGCPPADTMSPCGQSASAYLFVFAGMMDLQRYGVRAANDGTDPGEVAAWAVLALLSGRIAVINSTANTRG